MAGILVSKHDSVKYKNVMNRNGVSEEALIVKTNSTKTIVTSLNSIAKHKKLNIKLHFINKKNPDFSYFYSQNSKLNLPIKSGRNFANLDFSAAVPFLIAGKNVQNIIKPQEQSYLQHDGSYVPVIGTVEMDGKSNLNNHIFCSISPQTTNNTEKLKDYQVILDDGKATHNQKTLKIIKKAFHAQEVVTSAEKINNVKQKIIERNSVEYILLALITVVIIILNINLIVPMKYSINNSQLDGDLQSDFKIGFIFQYALYNLVAFILGYVVIQNWILIISKTPINIFFIVNIILTIVLGSFSILTKNRRTLD